MRPGGGGVRVGRGHSQALRGKSALHLSPAGSCCRLLSREMAWHMSSRSSAAARSSRGGQSGFGVQFCVYL